MFIMEMWPYYYHYAYIPFVTMKGTKPSDICFESIQETKIPRSYVNLINSANLASTPPTTFLPELQSDWLSLDLLIFEPYFSLTAYFVCRA